MKLRNKNDIGYEMQITAIYFEFMYKAFNGDGFHWTYAEEWKQRFIDGYEWQYSDYTRRKVLQQIRPEIYPTDLDEYFTR